MLQMMACRTFALTFCEEKVNEETRGSHMLDVVHNNELLILTDIIVDAPFANSDHASVCFCVLRPPTMHDTKQNVRLIYRWESADFDSLNAYLRPCDWTQFLTTNFTAYALWASFCNVLRILV